MKKSLLLLTTVLSLLFVKPTLAQYYNFSHSTQAYQSIANPQFTITDSVTLDTSSAYLGLNYTTVSSTAFGHALTGIMQVSPGGALVALGTSYDFIFDIFFTSLRPLGTSEFRATELIQGNDTILELEWYQFGLENAPNSSFVTMKFRFYLTQEIVEFSYGPSSVPTNHSFSVGPYSGVFHANKGFGSFIQAMTLSGSPSNPNVVTSAIVTLPSFPSNGTLYRFIGPQVTSIESVVETVIEKMQLYPNPSKGQITVNSSKELENIVIMNTMGQLVKQFDSLGKNSVTIDLGLSPGNYIVISNYTDGSLPSSKTLIIE